MPKGKMSKRGKSYSKKAVMKMTKKASNSTKKNGQAHGKKVFMGGMSPVGM